MRNGEPPARAETEQPLLPPDPAPLAGQTLAYGLSGLLVPLVGMITLPIFARVFTRGQYGVLELGTTAIVVGMTITDAGFTAAALRSFYDYRDAEERERRNVLLTAFLSTSAVALAVAGALILFRTSIAHWLFGSRGDEALVVLIALSIPVQNTWRFASEVMRVRFQAASYLVTTLIAAFVTTALGVTGVLALGWRVNGVFFAGLVGNSVAALFSVLLVRRGVSGSFTRRELRTMLAYGLPLVPSALAGWALALVDRIILARLGNLDQVGLYAISNRVASLLLIGMNAFLFALSPFLLATYSENPAQERLARGRTLTYLTFILTFGGLGLTLFSKEVIEVVAPGFGNAYEAVGPLVLSTVAYGIAAVLTIGISIARKTIILAVFSVLAAVVNIGLNFVLIPPYGFVGAGIATTIGYGVLALLYYWYSQRVYETPYEPARVLFMIAAASAFGVLGVVHLGPVAVAIPLKVAALGAFVGTLALTGTMGRREFLELRKFVVGMNPLRGRSSTPAT
jgi:O-antigen/teichoic acid export membrane protein